MSSFTLGLAKAYQLALLRKQVEGTKKIFATSLIKVCSYCDTPYIKSDVGSCINCGAPREIRDE